MRKPTPTEYKGTRYRSKSEAMFAATIQHEILLSNGLKVFPAVIYEPEFLEFRLLGSTEPEYVPDFLRITPFESGSFIRFEIFEYKPARPTRTYIECRLAGYFSYFHRKLERSNHNVITSLVFGSFFDEKPLQKTVMTDVGMAWTKEQDFVDDLISRERVKGIRFDLCN